MSRRWLPLVIKSYAEELNFIIMENVTTMSSKRIEEKPRDLKEDAYGRGMKQRWMQEGKNRK